MVTSLTGGGGGSPFNVNPLSPYSINPITGQPNLNLTQAADPNNGGYPGADARNQFIQSVADPRDQTYSASPFYNSLPAPPGYIPSPLAGAARENYSQTGLTQQSAYTDAMNANQSLGDQFYQQALANLQAQSGGGPNLADLQGQANQQAGLKYDPLIQQLQQNLGSAKTNEANASSQIGGLYNNLGKALAAQIPVITNQFKQQEDQSQQNYSTLVNQINNNYQGAKNTQAAELQKLGIQAALPQSTERLDSDQHYLSNQASTNGQSLNDAMRLMGQGQSDFAQRASIIAPTQGANLQAGLATQLQNLENQINQQIAGYQGQKGAAAASLLSQLQGQAQKDYASNQSQSLDQSYKLAELMKLTHPDAFATPKAPTSKYSGISGVGNYVADNSSVADPNEIMNDFMGFSQSKDYAGLTGPGGIGSPTLESAWQGLQKYAQQNDPSITPQGLQELYNALSIKYGKYS